MYTNSREMILEARRGGYAVPAFNAENLEMVQAIIEAAEEARSPVIIQTTPTTVRYMTLRQAVAMVRAEAEIAKVPVALHLDHCENYEGVADAIAAGYSSVMIDASKLPYEENIAVTQQVVAKARPLGITVESELGTVGGKEDSLTAAIAYTDPVQAVDFYHRTGIDLFANCHRHCPWVLQRRAEAEFRAACPNQRSVGLPIGASRRLRHSGRDDPPHHCPRHQQGELRNRAARCRYPCCAPGFDG